MTHAPGFTLIELLIVVILMAILAGVVVPSFSGAVPESKEAALSSNLASIRMCIEMYHAHHGDAFPTADLVDQLTESTDAAGDTAGTIFGPYLYMPWPENPVDGDSRVEFVANMPVGLPNEGAYGWIYATNNGQFRANTAGVGPSGTRYADL